MSGEVLKADLKSPLMLDSTSEGKVRILSNDLTPATGINYNDWTNTPCSNSIGTAGGALSGRTVVNVVQRNGKWQFAMCKAKFMIKSAGAIPAASLGNLGLRLVDQQLSTYSTPVFTQPTEALNYIFTLPAAEKQAILQRTLVLDPVTDLPVTGTLVKDTLYCTYVPSLIPSFTRTRSNWDTDILEPMLLKSTFADKKVLGFSAAESLHSGVDDGTLFNLYTQVIDYDPEYRDKLTLANFGNEGQNMAFFSYDFEQQIGPLTGVNQTKVKMASSVPVAIQMLYIRPSGTAAQTFGIPSYPVIPRIDLSLNSRKYIDDIPTSIMSYKLDSTGGGAASFLVGANAASTGGYSPVNALSNKVNTFCWCDRPQDRNGFSGGIAYGGVENPEFTFNYGTLVAADYEYVIVNLFYKELLMNGKSGRITSADAA